MTQATKAKKQKPLRRIRSAVRSAHGTVKRHYWQRMPAQKRHRMIVWAVFGIVASVIAGQMAYPVDRSLPLASIAGRSVAWRTYTESSQAAIQAFEDTKVRLAIGDRSAEFALKSLGAEPNIDKMVMQTTVYPFWQRFIPGSILWQPVQITNVDAFYSTKQLLEFSGQQAKAFSIAPENARLAIDDGKLIADDEQPGSKVESAALQQTIVDTRLRLGVVTTIDVPYDQIAPQFTKENLSDVRAQAQQALTHTVTITAGDRTFTPDPAQIASWLVITGDQTGRPTVSVDGDALRAYLDSVSQQVAVPAGQTDITIVDGREVGRTTGAMGRALNVDELIQGISTALLAPGQEINLSAQFVDVHPSVIFNSRYTTTQAGLQAYVQDVAASRNMHIVIQQLDGGQWYAHARDTESIPSASTFKLYLAKILFDKIDAGEIGWNDPMLDTTVAGCFERMTVASTNPCAESWIAQWGRGYINDYIYRLGFSTGTSFTTGGAIQTTAADLNRYMIMLHNGTILNGANRDRLLNSLGRHPYRYGIPTGSQGVVHDKVGFLWDYVHDTAIVQHPRGTYVMTIMTKGQSYGAIAAVTREVERIMYP